MEVRPKPELPTSGPIRRVLRLPVARGSQNRTRGGFFARNSGASPDATAEAADPSKGGRQIYSDGSVGVARGSGSAGGRFPSTTSTGFGTTARRCVATSAGVATAAVRYTSSCRTGATEGIPGPRNLVAVDPAAWIAAAAQPAGA